MKTLKALFTTISLCIFLCACTPERTPAKERSPDPLPANPTFVAQETEPDPIQKERPATTLQRTKRQPPRVDPKEKRACGDSIISFMMANRMMSDKDGNIVQLSKRQERKMKDLIRQGLKYSRKVSDEFLDGFHPQMKHLYRNNLVNGWAMYLEGSESDNVTEAVRKQTRAIRLLQRWDSFRIRNSELFVKKLGSG